MSSRSIWGRLRSPLQRFDPSPRARAIGRVGFSLFSFAMWLPAVFMLKVYVFDITKISGVSMYPFFNAERDQTLRRDVVLNWKYGAQDNLQRGMIVTFW